MITDGNINLYKRIVITANENFVGKYVRSFFILFKYL